ncbi:MAG: PEP-CTERM sorting domain-containing protein [Rubrivivax sp.]|nr:PEP-CTERM sorting domain-containing protein [Rubrivivax sp.]
MRSWVRSLCVGLAAAACASAQAEVIYTPLAVPLSTPSNPGGGNNDGTGVWFNPLTGYAEVRGFFFPDTLFEDGKFFLLRDTSFNTPAAQIYTQGFFARGNGVIYEAADNLNPARFGLGAVIGPGTGYQNPGAGFPDLGPTFGNWGAGGQGFLGLTLRDPTGNSSADIFYGFADITVNADFSITLNAFAYENVRGAAITTAVPEPGAAALLLAGLAGVAGVARRRRAG